MTIMEAAIRNAGVMKGSRAVTVMIQWSMARESMGDAWPAEGIEAQVRAYSDWWRHSERTGWNDLARFRAAFPGESTPERFLDFARAQWDERRGVKGLGALPLPA